MEEMWVVDSGCTSEKGMNINFINISQKRVKGAKKACSIAGFLGLVSLF